ncbi:hypothetical protein MBRA1_003725 [Malassezia brasiliensis]|uniref:Signal recognition particle receptor subunit beta n=1 Tax=Malassezia brasiliensis TaxID=1821822 RepID=A0AAF0E0W0_9BASI|nr:hypothetical protein MBRA1_003725 [Malassezia brasiliensis]
MRAVCEAWSAAGPLPGAVCTELGMRVAWGVCVAVAAAAILAAVVARRTAPAKEAAVAARPTRTHPTVLLLGGERAGKTNVFLRLAMDVAPDTATSQRVNTADVAASDRTPAMHLVDVPGHARLRHAAHAHLDEADALVYCIDASVASRGGSESATAAAALSTMKRTDLQAALMDSVDWLHDTLCALAARREARATRAPPALLVLFTRADLSPVFADRHSLQDEKRRAQLLARCRRGLDAALASRRASRGLATQTGRVTVEGIAEIDAAHTSLWTRMYTAAKPVLRALPFLAWAAPEDERVAAELHPTRFGHNVRAGAGHRREAQADYVARTSRAGDEVLAQLQASLVEDGRAHFGLASIDRRGAWQPGAGEDRLEDVHAWLARLAT